MPDKKLVVLGDGPDFDKIKAKAGTNVTLLGYQPNYCFGGLFTTRKSIYFCC